MKGNDKIYDGAFKDKPVRLSYKRNCIEKLEKELELYFASILDWQKYQHKAGEQNYTAKGSFLSENETIIFLEKKILLSDLKFEILKKGKFYISQEGPGLFHFIKSNEKKYSIRQMCSVLKVNRSTYRKWSNQFVSEKKRKKNLLQKEIASIFFEAKQRYGHKRITIELQNRGYRISRWKVFYNMNELGLSVNNKNTDKTH